MRCKRNVKLYAIYGLAAFNLVILFFTHVLHPVDDAQTIVEKLRGKKLSVVHPEIKPYAPVLITNLSNPEINKDERPFDRYNLFGNISNDFQIFPQFNLLLNPSNRYQNDEENYCSDIFLLVLVTSSVRNFKQRQAVRDTWASVQSVKGKRILTLFMLGVNVGGRKFYMEQVRAEYAKFGDIIVEDFSDTYMNLTLKTIMGFKWTTMFCPTAKYVMKTDDDMLINLNYTVQYLAKQPPNTKRFVIGHVINGSPIRNDQSKWYMSYKLYPYLDYPPFASGTCYVMSTDVVLDTYQISRRFRYLHLEDIFSALCWERLGIVPSNHRGFNLNRVHYSYCRYKKLVSVHGVKVYKMYELWKEFSEDSAKSSQYYCLFNGWFF